MFRVHYDALGAIANLSRLTTVRQRVGRVAAAAVAARARFDDARAGAVPVPLLPLVIVGGGGRFFLCPRVAVAGATPILSLRR